MGKVTSPQLKTIINEAQALTPFKEDYVCKSQRFKTQKII